MTTAEREPDEHAGMSLERISALTDGVIAIVLTLLVLLIEPPKGHESFQELMAALVEMKSLFLAYLVAFVQVTLYWKRQHGIFRRLTQLDGPVFWLSMLFLMFVAFVPFPTALMCSYFDTSAIGGVTAIFCAVHAICSLLLWLCWRHGSKNGHIQGPQSRGARQLALHLRLSTLGYILAIPLALVDEHLALLTILLSSLVEVLPSRTSR